MKAMETRRCNALAGVNSNILWVLLLGRLGQHNIFEATISSLELNHVSAQISLVVPYITDTNAMLEAQTPRRSLLMTPLHLLLSLGPLGSPLLP
jgi:hypothetical protein